MKKKIRLLVLVAVTLVMLISAAACGKSDDSPSIPIENLQAPSEAPRYYGEEWSAKFPIEGPGDNPDGITVIASFVEALPDTYTFFDDWQQDEIRLLRMKTEKLLIGGKMTDEFYYIIPKEYMTDFSLYDRFLIKDMAQFQYEYSVVYNQTQGSAERLDLVVFGYINYNYNMMGERLAAYGNDGNFDIRLWESSDIWKECTRGNADHAFATLADAEAYAQSQSDRYYAHSLSGITGEAAEELSRITSLENGIYAKDEDSVMYLSPEVQLHVTRYINGFATNETVIIRGREWSNSDEDLFIRSKATFDEKDLEKLPDLASALASVNAAFERGEIAPPHIVDTENVFLSPTHGIFGWYAKTPDGVIGVVRVSWSFHRDHAFIDYDDAYYVVEYGSNVCKAISRDDLLEKLGEYEGKYIFAGEYDDRGKVYESKGVIFG